MNEIIDAGRHWPMLNPRVAQQQIRVTMAGQNGLQAVSSGKPRMGQAVVNGNVYPIHLPGLQGGGLDAEFTRQ
ncbi:hypothetical protein [Aquitalea sp. ASV15]|uniref:hypothetical protein n=1 Tax=Aquitalea sp. ASV15 TaxID=2795104 RepID=UPI0018ED7601|nr:hypothetical protein [Aquitalea sp. ASV15]